MSRGNLFIVTGPSGAGKGTVLGKVTPSMEALHYSVSATTRGPREGEQDGVNYYFLEKQEFLNMIDRGEFLEYAEYVGNYYGTPAGPVDECLEKGMDVILEIEVQGGADRQAQAAGGEAGIHRAALFFRFGASTALSRERDRRSDCRADE